MPNEKIELLRNMLDQVAPGRTSNRLRESLESASGTSGPTLDSNSIDPMAEAEMQIAVESMEFLQRGDEIDDQKRFALEAIVMPFYRPVIDIVDNAIAISQLTTEWKHLAEIENRSRLEQRLLSVGRLEVPGDTLSPYVGTGYVVGKTDDRHSIIMTNRHVAEKFASGLGTRKLKFISGRSANIDFRREYQREESDSLKVNRIVMIHPYWDMALLEVMGLHPDRQPLTLATGAPESFAGREIAVIGYPGFDPFGDTDYQQTQARIFRNVYYVKRLQPGVLRDRKDIESYDNIVPAITHDCSTLGGNSGSAVIDIQSGDVIALHFAGSYLLANYAVPTHDLAQDARVVDTGINFDGGKVPPSDSLDNYWRLAESESSEQISARNTPAPYRDSQSTAAAPNNNRRIAISRDNPVRFSQPGGFTFEIPLRITVSVGDLKNAGSERQADDASPSDSQSAANPRNDDEANPTEVSSSNGPRRSTESRRQRSLLDHRSLDERGFTWKTAFSMALCSQLAYQPKKTIERIAKSDWHFNDVAFIESGDTQCYFASTDTATVLSFRGSESLGDWIANLQLSTASRDYGKVHSGFCAAYEVVRNEIIEKIEAFRNPNRKLILTGHSLGGALATIAIADLRKRFPITVAYTFGQPRVGKKSFDTFAQQHFAGVLYRVVNDDDIVPQIPPGFSHVGQLLHLNANGNLLSESVEASSGSVETEMSVEDFEQLQRRLKEGNSLTESSLDVFSATEGVFPSFSDHSIARYITKVRRLAMHKTNDEAEYTRNFDPIVEFVGGDFPDTLIPLSHGKVDGVLVESGSDRNRFPSIETIRNDGNQGAPDESSPVLLRVSETDWEAPDGLAVQSRIGTFITATCTQSQIISLSRDPNVLSIEASRDAGVPELANSKPFTRATNVHRPPIEEFGDSALVGVIDTGIDILHRSFLDANGKSRILAIWNQQETPQEGSYLDSPHGTFPNDFTQDYGVLYLVSDIQRLINKGTAGVPSRLRDPGFMNGHGHGTHVSSIAAGRQVGSFAGGIAPDAKIIVVIPNMLTAPENPTSLGYSVSHVDAVDFLVKSAASTAIGNGLPIAVNVSLGMNAGAHDGQSNLEAAFDASSNQGKKPGIVIIKSAGNEGDSGGHAALAAFEGMQQITWQSSNTPRPRDYIEVWYKFQHELEFRLIDPDENASETVSAAQPSWEDTLGGNKCLLHLTPNHPDAGDNRLQIVIRDNPLRIQSGVWRLEINGVFVGGIDQTIHAWVERDPARAVRFLTGDANANTLSIPGTAQHIITVSASGSEQPLRLTESSSRGPTRDNRMKPDVCAPGINIIAASSNSNDHEAVTPMTGTSMAAPHVTGAVALALSMRHKSGRRQLNANQIKCLLCKTTMGHDRNHNDSFGFGALDVEAFIKMVSDMP